MPKNVVIITSSLRVGSNSDALAEAFARGARDAGHSVEVISLKEKMIAFCRGCLTCQKTGKCVVNDDAVAIAEKSAKRMWWLLLRRSIITGFQGS